MFVDNTGFSDKLLFTVPENNIVHQLSRNIDYQEIDDHFINIRTKRKEKFVHQVT